MIPFLRERYGNPSSIYGLGEEITEAMEEARDKVANLINGARMKSSSRQGEPNRITGQ